MKQLIISMAVAAVLSVPAWAQVRTQAVSLEKGWNAVWIEVEPETPGLADIFDGKPVDIVAGYTKPVSEAQFVKNTAVNVQSLAGWNTWYAPYRADAPLSRLHRFNADTGYLVHALEAMTLSIPGTVTGGAVRWTPNRFNLVGFGVAEQGGPTFKEFFQGSTAHNHNKIYRLADGVWRQVLTPASEVLRTGEAFWVYCDGASDYQGPLSVTANTKMGLVLNGSLKGSVEFGNATPHPLAFTLEQVVAGGNADLPLAAVVSAALPTAVRLADTPVDFPSGVWTQEFPAFEAGGGVTLPFILRVKDIEAGSYAGLLKVTTDLGSVTWLPVHAER